MDADDFLDEETTSDVLRYEKMVRTKTQEYFDAETLENIIEFYIGKEKLKKGLEVVYYGEEQYPYYTGFKMKKAEIFIMMGKHDDAIQELEQIELYEPFNAELFLLKGEVFVHTEQIATAEEYFKKALSYSDNQIDTLFEIAYIYQDADFYLQAIVYFESVLEQDHQQEQALYEIANCYDLIGRYDRCVDYYNMLIELDPFSANAWYNLGVIYTKMGEFKLSAEALDYCLAIEEDYTPARFNKANALVELEQYEQAIVEYKLVLEKEGADSITLCNLAGCYERLDQNALARETYKKATAVNPNIGEAWFGIGLTFEKDQNMHEAIAYFRRAALLEPENTEYLLVLAEAEYRIGNEKDAQEIYKTLLDIDPTMMEAWMDWSYIIYMRGDVDLAIAVLKEAIKIDPECHPYQYRVAIYLLEAGRQTEALYYLENALTLCYDDHFLLFEMAPQLKLIPAVTELIENYKKPS